jgi:hypothetical protein
LLAGFLALTVRILLLLSRLLATALLLARLLPGILVLLAGILVLIGHRDLPFSKSPEDNLGTPTWLRGNAGSLPAFSDLAEPWFRRSLHAEAEKLSLYKRLRHLPAQLPLRVPAVRK